MHLSQVERGGSVEKYRLILVVTILVLTGGRVGTAAATRAPAFLLRGSVGERAENFGVLSPSSVSN